MSEDGEQDGELQKSIIWCKLVRKNEKKIRRGANMSSPEKESKFVREPDPYFLSYTVIP